VEARVVRLSIAPVKSLGLVHPEEVELEPHGVRGNRRFWLVDEDGRLYNGKRGGPMVRIRPEWDEETRRLALTFPDGAHVEGTVELGDFVDADMYEHPHPSRRVLGPWEDAISEFVGRRLTLLWAEQHAVDRGYRGGTVSLVSRASATILLNGDVGRCVVTSHDPERGVTDLDTLGVLARYRREGRNEPLPFGVYGAVAVPGIVRVGDPVQALHSKSAILLGDGSTS
jgi:uncharacterized protein YcbX